MNETIAILIILALIIIFLIVYFGRTNVRDNGNPINKARDNNRKSEDINKQTSRTLEKLRSENREVADLNKSIREDNKTAGDIIKEVRNQKLD